MLSGFLQHVYWASSDSLLVFLCRYRLWPNITSSSSRCHGGRRCPAKVPLIAHRLVAAAPHSSASGQVGLKPGAKPILQPALCEATCLLFPGMGINVLPQAVPLPKSGEEQLSSSRASSEQLSTERTSVHDQRDAWTGVIQQGAEGGWFLSSSSLSALLRSIPPLLSDVVTVQCPKSLSGATTGLHSTLSLLRSHPAALSQKEKSPILHSWLHTPVFPSGLHVPVIKPQVLYPALLLLKILTIVLKHVRATVCPLWVLPSHPPWAPHSCQLWKAFRDKPKLHQEVNIL